MAKVPQEFMIVSDYDCDTVSTISDALETANRHFENSKDFLDEVKIYKLHTIGNQSKKITFST